MVQVCFQLSGKQAPLPDGDGIASVIGFGKEPVAAYGDMRIRFMGKDIQLCRQGSGSQNVVRIQKTDKISLCLRNARVASRTQPHVVLRNDGNGVLVFFKYVRGVVGRASSTTMISTATSCAACA